jgi:hypothetical protein
MDLMTEDSMVAYFLGELSESESRRLEEESLRNEELFDQLHSKEEALIDAYVRGDMTSERKAQYELHYLNTERRRERVALADALMQKYNTEGIKPARATPPAPVSAYIFAKNLAWPAAIAAVILLVVAIGLWAKWRSDKASSLQATGANATPTRQASPSTPVASPTATISEDSSTSPVPTPKAMLSPSLPLSPKNAPDVSAQTSPVFATFTLWPGSFRSESATGRLLNLPSATTMVRLHLVLKENQLASYRAELQTPEGATVFTKQRLKATTAGSQSVVILDMPARKLESRHYLLVLYNAEKLRTDVPSAEYVFKVAKQ